MKIVTAENDSNCLTLESYSGRQPIPLDSCFSSNLWSDLRRPHTVTVLQYYCPDVRLPKLIKVHMLSVCFDANQYGVVPALFTMLEHV